MPRWFVSLVELEHQRRFFSDRIANLDDEHRLNINIVEAIKGKLRLFLAREKNPGALALPGSLVHECRSLAREFRQHKEIVRLRNTELIAYKVAFTVCCKLIEGWNEEYLSSRDEAIKNGEEWNGEDDWPYEFLTPELAITSEEYATYAKLCPPAPYLDY